MPSDRQRLPARVDDETRERWWEFCAEHDMTLSSFAEAIGRNLPPPGSKLPPWLAKVTADARAIRRERWNPRRPPA